MKKALITGITGQDGSYLAELLLSKGYQVHGIIRRASTFNTGRIEHIYVDRHADDVRLLLHFGDLSDTSRLTSLIYDIRPDEVYHLGAQSHVRVSFDIPEYTADITGIGTTRLLEAIRLSGLNVRFYQASSSEMFGDTPPPQREESPFRPRSPYAASKVYCYWLINCYREGYGLFACNGILFNHESPRRGKTFVTRKITQAVANIIAGKQRKLYLGNLDAKRDWGFAPEYVEFQWRILQQPHPDDYVIGTGESHSVREFVERAFSYAGIEIEWQGDELEEKGLVASVDDRIARSDEFPKPGSVLIEIDRRYFRPTEVGHLLADPGKAKRQIDWQPRITFDSLVKIMVDADLEEIGLNSPGASRDILQQHGFSWVGRP